MKLLRAFFLGSARRQQSVVARALLLTLLATPTLFTQSVAHANDPITTATHAAADKDPTTIRIHQILASAMQNDLLAKWLDDRINDSIKHGLDAAVDQYLRNNPLVRRLLPEIQDALKSQTGATRLTLLSQMGLAMKPDAQGRGGQMEDKLAMAEDVARRLHFPASAIEDLHLFVSSSGTINAFTYSPLPDKYIDLVLFQGLITLLNPDELKAVIGHEIGHIKARHVLNQILLISVFKATGENAIPNDPASARLSRLLTRTLNAETRRLAVEGRWNSAFPREVKEALGQRAINMVEDVSRLLRSNLNSQELISLNQGLQAALMDHNAEPTLESSTQNSAAAGGRPVITPADIEKFQASLARYSRSCETSADRYGLLVTNLQAAMGTDAKLAGGPDTNVDAIRRQADNLIGALARHPHMVQDIIDSQETHPAPVARAVQYHLFMQSAAYRIYSNPFWKALDAYVGVNKTLEGPEQKPTSLGIPRAPSPDVSELLRAYQRTSEAGQYEVFSQDIMNVVMEAIVAEFKATPRTSLTKFEALVTYFNELKKQNTIPRRTVMPEGLVFELRKQLKTLDQDNLTKSAITILSTFIPVEARGANGPLMDVVETQLAEFKALICENTLTTK